MALSDTSFNYDLHGLVADLLTRILLEQMWESQGRRWETPRETQTERQLGRRLGILSAIAQQLKGGF